MSRRLGFLEKEGDIENMMGQIESHVRTSVVTGNFTLLVTLQGWLVKLIGGTSLYHYVDICSNRLQEIKALRQRSHDGAEPKELEAAMPDICARIVAMNERDLAEGKKPHALQGDNAVMTVAFVNLGAGSDTTSIALNSILFYALAQPAVHDKLRAEFDEAYARQALSDPPTWAQTQELPYFQAVVKESFRMHAVVGLPLWREVPKGGAMICGTFFPAGTNLGINGAVAHHNRDVWGQDADEFRPERWLESSPEQLKEMNAYFMPFGL